MAQKLSAGCVCGAIHYECSADPVIVLNCHCRDCQQASGSAYAAIVVVPKTAVQFRGEPRYHKVVGKAGTGRPKAHACSADKVIEYGHVCGFVTRSN